MKNKQVLSIINLLGFIFLLMASFVFARTGNMFNTNEIMPIFMPAPYAFSIWILIYILLGIWVIKGFFANTDEEVMYEDVGYWFVVCMIFTGLTILVPTKISPIFIIIALVTALVIYTIISKSYVSKLFKVPFSFLTAWLSVATIVNISLVLKMMGITEIFGIGEVGWAIIMLVIGTLIAILFTITQMDNIYALVFIWGYVAIAIHNKVIQSVVRTSIIMCVILAITIGYNLYRCRVKNYNTIYR
ncbi:hypothetical protein [Clostridium sp.]|uniref:hypothetical protein n=1 Tax=Clostridium sp. TaxID=1506 RepID=UPI003216AF89